MRAFRRTYGRWHNLLGLLMVLGIVAVSLAAPRLAPPLDPADPSPFKTVGRVSDNTPHPPGERTLLGTTAQQQDVYYTIIWGTRSALIFGLVVALIAGLLGVVLGATAAFAGGLLGRLVLGVTDAFLTFPVIAGVWLFQQVLVPNLSQEAPTPLQRALLFLQPDPLMVTLTVFSWMPYARLTHAVVRSLAESEFITAARSVGASSLRIIGRHILPNAVAPAIILAARDVGGLVLLQASLTFIGVAGDSPWGVLLALGRNWIVGPGGNPFRYWWVFAPATLAVMLFSIAFNLLGDSLNDLLNPRPRK